MNAMGVRLVKASALLPSQQAAAEEPSFPFGLARSGVQEVAEASFGDHAAVTGFAMAAAEDAKAAGILWITGHRQAHEHGRLSERWARTSLASSVEAILHVEARKTEHLLWAAEEAIKSRAVSLVIVESEAPDFTASRRLSLASETSGVPAILLLPARTQGSTAAQARWRVASAPSLPNPFDPEAPGIPVWDVTLERCRTAPSQVGRHFTLKADDEPLSLDPSPGLAPDKVAPGAGQALPLRRIAG
ncbi:MAG: hypothetical protein AAFR65_02270 [Pseudomonadota bacterium]